MRGLIKIAVVLTFATVSTGNLPSILKTVQKAQLHLIQDPFSTDKVINSVVIHFI